MLFLILVMHSVTCKLFFNCREPVPPTDVTEGAEPETNDDVQTEEDGEEGAVEFMSRIRERVLKKHRGGTAAPKETL